MYCRSQNLNFESKNVGMKTELAKSLDQLVTL